MAKNIEINILNSSGSYETLYPTTDYNNLLNKPTIPTVPSLPLSIANGGTAGNSAANAVYNLLQGLSSRTASNVNSYASSTYLGCYYGSTGYKVPISNLMTYINNNVSVSGGLKIETYYSTGGTLIIATSMTTPQLLFTVGYNSSGVSSNSVKVDMGMMINIKGNYSSLGNDNFGWAWLNEESAGNTIGSLKGYGVNGPTNASFSNNSININSSWGITYFFRQSGTKLCHMVIGT